MEMSEGLKEKLSEVIVKSMEGEKLTPLIMIRDDEKLQELINTSHASMDSLSMEQEKLDGKMHEFRREMWVGISNNLKAKGLVSDETPLLKIRDGVIYRVDMENRDES